MAANEEDDRVEEEQEGFKTVDAENTYRSEPRGAAAISFFLALVVILIFGYLAYVSFLSGQMLAAFAEIAAGLIIAATIASSIRINNQWENSIILRLGKYSRFKGPGIFFIIPFIEDVIKRDMRVRTTTFTAERTLTKDNVPVNVDAVLFWQIKDAKKSVTVIQDYYGSIVKASMTTMRDIIGQTDLATMLSDRITMDEKLKKIIEAKATNWGLEVSSVEVRDIKIPSQLQDAMSRKAQAEKEKLARVELADSEVQIARKFQDAAKIYEQNPEAMKLRAMNMLYESVKEKGTFIIVPSDIVTTMGYSSTLGLVSAAQNAKDAAKHPEGKEGKSKSSRK
jgi:regulator of protease activity HflC (stomatin/prohibitin superfamily)